MPDAGSAVRKEGGSTPPQKKRTKTGQNDQKSPGSWLDSLDGPRCTYSRMVAGPWGRARGGTSRSHSPVCLSGGGQSLLQPHYWGADSVSSSSWKTPARRHRLAPLGQRMETAWWAGRGRKQTRQEPQAHAPHEDRCKNPNEILASRIQLRIKQTNGRVRRILKCKVGITSQDE